MYDHIGLRVADLDASIRFYTAVLKPLGHVLCSSGDGYAGFGPKGEPALWLHLNKGRKADGAHVAFRARDQDAVKKFHAKASRPAAATMAARARARTTARPITRRS